jgi:MtN3 and saliva related transmembrane protein
MDSSDLLGLAAGALTTIAFVPQVIKTWRSRSTEDISLAMFSVFSVGVVLWLAYGIAIHSWPIVAANVVTLCLSLTILYFKLRGG